MTSEKPTPTSPFARWRTVGFWDWGKQVGRVVAFGTQYVVEGANSAMLDWFWKYNDGEPD